MGKKSVVDSSFVESAFEDMNNLPTEAKPASPVDELQTLLIQMLKSAKITQRKQASDMSVYQLSSLIIAIIIHLTSDLSFHVFRGGGDPA